MNDREIINLFLARDENAIKLTDERYGAKLKSIAFAILNDRESAEECINDTYLEAWNRIPPHEPADYLLEFLTKIVRHIAIDRCRKEKRQKRRVESCELTQEMLECIPAENSDDGQGCEDLTEVINRFLETCTDEQQNVFVRRYWYFDTIPQISERYGFTQSKVKVMLHRMRTNLKKRLKAKGYDI